MEGLLYYLVEQPMVAHYEWVPGQSIGSTPLFLGLTVLTYLGLTLLLATLPCLPSLELRVVSAAHNLGLSGLSLLMAVGTTLSAAQQFGGREAVCFPPGTRARGPTFFWAHVFYLSKILEFADTLLILLSGSRSRRLSFLHVYHHALVVVMCWIWLSTSQTLLPVALVTNASVHVLMYAYYFLTALGFRPRWKRLVTDCQILQFVFSFLLSALMLWFHFRGEGCSGIFGWCFNALFNASLFALFLHFHAKNYATRRKDHDKNKNL